MAIITLMDNLDREKYYRAAERLKAHKKFYADLLKYVVVIAFLAGLNYYTNQWNNMWFLWVAFFWGLGLVFEALKVFQWNPFLGKDWEERKLKQFMTEEDVKSSTKKSWE